MTRPPGHGCAGMVYGTLFGALVWAMVIVLAWWWLTTR